MIWKLTLLLALMMLWTGAMLHEEGATPELVENITGRLRYDNFNFTFQDEGNNEDNRFIVRILYKYVDFLGFAVISGINTALNYGYTNPQYNFKLAWNILIIGIILMCVKPLFYLGAFLWFGGVSFKKWLRARKLKKVAKDK